jgi:hypothetical protein
MITVPFVASSTAQFSFSAVLDGNLYTISTPWNLYRQDYYVQINDSSGNLIVHRARVGSPAGSPSFLDINLAFGYFSINTLVWRPSTGNFEVGP